jgi:two-component system OmpR family sensor kinase
MSRLWVRLTLAFAIVVLVAVGTVAVLANLRAGEAFRLYLSYSRSDRPDALAETLAAYYREYGSWEGIQVFLERVPMMLGPGMGMRPGFGFPRDSEALVVLADAANVVLYERPDSRPGRRLSADEQAAAQEITVGGELVGRLVVALPMQQAIWGPLEERFFARMRQFLAVGALAAGGLGLLIGLGFSRSLSAPLQRLAWAARAVARQDFSQRVEARGSAEMADVAQAFNEMANALEQAEQQRKNLVADVAHELRTPLTVLQGNLRAILDDVYALDKAEVSRLYDETLLLSRLVDDLRQLALADAGQLELNVQPTALGTALRLATDSLAVPADAQQVTMEVEALPELPMVQADPDRLAQILHNLLANALRHTPAGGRITVRATATGIEAQVEVRDSGEGIAPEDLPHIFDRFWRADRARSRDSQAAPRTGLGLSIAQTLVEAHGGRIWAESAPGDGATFRFTLPMYSPA